MKKLLPILLAFLSINLNAQAPQGFNYQASIRDASNNIVTNQNVSLRITLTKDSISGTNVYQETFSDSTTSLGTVSIVIGTGTVISGSFSSIDWGNGPYFIETAVDVSGGTTYQVMGTQQLMSVPYALHAENVSDGVKYITFSDTLTSSTPDTLAIPHNLDISKIINVSVVAMDTNNIWHYENDCFYLDSTNHCIGSPFVQSIDQNNIYLNSLQTFTILGITTTGLGGLSLLDRCIYKITITKEGQ